jgi:hypothetical protein
MNESTNQPETRSMIDRIILTSLDHITPSSLTIILFLSSMIVHLHFMHSRSFVTLYIS